jgi:hypothetical protein
MFALMNRSQSLDHSAGLYPASAADRLTSSIGGLLPIELWGAPRCSLYDSAWNLRMTAICASVNFDRFMVLPHPTARIRRAATLEFSIKDR